ncbi:MAG TPA: NAD(P)-dependent oxidoreductase [Kofleriaceae bacterium]|jgi:uroporphyrin-III C-methyltransferase/precorrin-2 dehydrogenase/sirohydrochlorin ferrochelatase
MLPESLLESLPESPPESQAQSPRLYPVFLKLAGLPVVVVGGGTVAAGKLAGLIEAGAEITVVAPAIRDEIRHRAAAPASALRLRLRLIERGFAPSDLDGARWVVAAATPEVNREVAAAATARGLFVNAVDDIASATAYLGGVIRRGQAVLAISTGGLAPALAGLLREGLDALLPDDLERWFDVARTARASWKRAGTPMAERRPLLLRALARLYRSEPDAGDAGGAPDADVAHGGAREAAS